jgi:hypothetical protein
MDTKEFILQKLDELNLTDLRARPYDCTFSLLDSPKEEKRLIIIGFNGSLADDIWTNATAIEHGFHNPNFFNVAEGIEGNWKAATLPKRLIDIPKALGFDPCKTIYTNAILLCSDNASGIITRAKNEAIDIDLLIENSMKFFADVTLNISDPELIIVFGNGNDKYSTSNILYKYFSISEIHEVENNDYYKTFSFLSNINEKIIPIVCIRHMSRFKPNTEFIKEAWNKQKQNLSL